MTKPKLDTTIFKSKCKTSIKILTNLYKETGFSTLTYKNNEEFISVELNNDNYLNELNKAILFSPFSLRLRDPNNDFNEIDIDQSYIKKDTI